MVVTPMILRPSISAFAPVREMADLGCVLGDTQHQGDLGEGQVLEIAKDEDLAVTVAQRFERLPHPASILFAAKVPGGAGAAGRQAVNQMVVRPVG